MKLTTLISVILALASATCFADSSNTKLNALGKAFKNSHISQPQQLKNSIAIVYGGADVARKPDLDIITAT